MCVAQSVSPGIVNSPGFSASSLAFRRQRQRRRRNARDGEEGYALTPGLTPWATHIPRRPGLKPYPELTLLSLFPQAQKKGT